MIARLPEDNGIDCSKQKELDEAAMINLDMGDFEKPKRKPNRHERRAAAALGEGGSDD